MSEENVEVCRAVFDTFSRGDTPAMLELFDPSVVFTPLRMHRTSSPSTGTKVCCRA